jgi:hypothetical protein
MKTKFVGIFVCMLLITTALSAAGASNIQTLRHVMENYEFEPYPSTHIDSSSNVAIKIVGEITDVYDDYNLLGGAIQIGDKISGKYIYDSATPDSNPDPQIGEYGYASTPYRIELESAGFVFKTDPDNVEFGILIFDNFYYYLGDLYGVYSYNNLALSNGIPVHSIVFMLYDSTGNAISSDVLPDTAPVLSDWEESVLMIYGSSPYNPYEMYIITGNVTKITLNRSKTRDRDVYVPTNPILIWLIERFPNVFPKLRQLLGL